jgi:hypothetical protein
MRKAREHRASHRVVTSPLPIGRSSPCDLQLDEASVSRQHARESDASAVYRISDLGSTNGTYVNDVPQKTTALRHGDQIQIDPARECLLPARECLLVLRARECLLRPACAPMPSASCLRANAFCVLPARECVLRRTCARACFLRARVRVTPLTITPRRARRPRRVDRNSPSSRDRLRRAAHRGDLGGRGGRAHRAHRWGGGQPSQPPPHHPHPGNPPPSAGTTMNTSR